MLLKQLDDQMPKILKNKISIDIDHVPYTKINSKWKIYKQKVKNLKFHQEDICDLDFEDEFLVTTLKLKEILLFERYVRE